MAILKSSDEVYIVGNHGKGFTQASIGLTVESHGGTVTKKLTPNTTHVLIPASDWSPPSARATAIADHALTHPLWVLPLGWLADSVAENKRKKESDYDLQSARSPAASASPPPAPAVKNGNGKGKGKRAKSESDDDAPPPAPKIVKATMKGSAPPVDNRFPHAASTHVHAGPDGVYWDAMLNQTEIGANKNKFYVIQVLKSDSGNTFYCFNVWGRVGENGQQKVFGPYGAVSQAIADFEKKFKDKTKLTWSNRTAAPVAKMYTYLERSFEEDDDEEEAEAASPKKKARTDDAPALVSKLQPQVQSLIQMIFNVSAMNQTLSSFEYDASKLPLGKLSKATMDQGYAALKEIAALLTSGQGTRDDYREPTNRYYTCVPHVFGRNVPPVIDNQDRLKNELDLIDALGQLKITTELMAVPKGPSADLHPLDAQFQNLGLKQLDPIPSTSKEFSVLRDLLRNTKGETHNAWELEIKDAFKVCREKDDDQFVKGGFDKLKGGQRRLLWHGSSNYGGILSQGLRIAPPEAPVSGYMFGKGLYLASMATKSAGYCYHGISNNEGLLMLIEAQLGPNPMYVRETAEYEAESSCKKAKMLATWGVGRTQPAKWEDAGKLSPDLKGVLMPSTVAPPHEANKTSTLLYDEFITYSTAQVRIRYLLRVKFVNGQRGY